MQSGYPESFEATRPLRITRDENILEGFAQRKARENLKTCKNGAVELCYINFEAIPDLYFCK